jgi:hypothetical protein
MTLDSNVKIGIETKRNLWHRDLEAVPRRAELLLARRHRPTRYAAV